MDQPLIDFINSTATLGYIRNMGVLNPVILDIAQPLTGNLFTIVAAVREPSSAGLPLYATWICFQPGPYYRKALQLVSTAAPVSGSNIIDTEGYAQSWVELTLYAQIFATPQLDYTVPMGPMGPQGPAAVVDYAYIIAQVLAAGPVKTLTSITINGPGSFTPSSTSNYTVTAHYSDSTSAPVTPSSWTLSPALGTINAGGTLTAAPVTSSTGGTLGASYTEGGITMTDSINLTNAPVVIPIYPFYGVAPVSSVKNAALVLGLSGRGSVGDLTSIFTLDSGVAGDTTTMFYAYPQSYGLARFQDTANPGLFGGWDAATGDPTTGATGPMSLNVTIAGVSVPFYLYQTDNTGLGSITWQAMH